MPSTPNAPYEVPPEMRDFAEKSVDQARKALDGFLGAANKAVDSIQGSTSTLQSTATEATRKTLTYAEQSLTAAFDHAQKLVRARDMQEALSIQTEFARAQFESLQQQLKDLGEMAQSATRAATSQASSQAASAVHQAAATTKQATSAVRGTTE